MPDALYLAQLLYMFARTDDELYILAFQDALTSWRC